MWYRRRWIIFGHEIWFEVKEASEYLIRKNWKAIRKAQRKTETTKVYSFMEHFIKFPESYLTGEKYGRYLPKKGKLMNDISTQMADAVVQLYEQGKPKEITTQSPEVTGVEPEVTVGRADTERSSYTPVVI